MSRKIKFIRPKVYEVANTKMAKPLLKLIKDLDDLYWFNAKKLFKTTKLFKSLYYSPQTTKATRAYMLWAGLSGSPAKPNAIIKSGVTAANFRKAGGFPRLFKVDFKFNKKGQPVGFEVKGINEVSKKMETMPETKEVTKALKEAKFDKLSGNVAAQIIEKKIDPDKGVWILNLTTDVKKVLLILYYLINGLMRKIKTSKNTVFEYEAIENEDALLKDEHEEIEGEKKVKINMSRFLGNLRNAFDDYKQHVSPVLVYYSAQDEGIVLEHHIQYLIGEVDDLDQRVLTMEGRDYRLDILYNVCSKTIWPLHDLMYKISSAKFYEGDGKEHLAKLTKPFEKFALKTETSGYKSFATEDQVDKSFETSVKKLFDRLDEQWKPKTHVVKPKNK